jgi:hypothetical protein
MYVDAIWVLKTRCHLGSHPRFMRPARTLVLLHFFAFFSRFFLFSASRSLQHFSRASVPCVSSLPFYTWHAIFFPFRSSHPEHSRPPPSSVSPTSAHPTTSTLTAFGATVAPNHLPPPSRPPLCEIQILSALTLGHRHRRNDEAITRPSASPSRHPTLGCAASPPPVCSMRIPAEPTSMPAPNANETPWLRRWKGRSGEPSAGGGMVTHGGR